MLRLSFLLLCLAGSSAPARAQLSVLACPVPFYSGTYGGHQVSDAEIVVNARGLYRFSEKGNTGAPGSLRIRHTDCDGNFVLEIGGIEIIMRSALRADWIERGMPTYIGESPFGASRVGTELTAESATRLLVTMGGSVTIEPGQGGSWDAGALADFEGSKRPRPECACREKLQTHIDDAIREAKRVEAFYRNAAYRKRPAGMPADVPGMTLWHGEVYEAMIYDMAFGKQSYAEASQAVVTHARQVLSGIPAAPGQQAAPGGAGDAASTTSAQTDPIDCTTVFGTDHLEGCFPVLDREVTDAHEAVHRAECVARNTAATAAGQRIGSNYDPFDVDAYAEEEADGYAAEAEYLKTWIKDNC